MKQVLIGVCLLAMACQPTKPAPRIDVKEAETLATTQSLAAAQTPAEVEPAEQPVALPAGTFAFGDDSAGRILGRVLPPSEHAKLPADSKAEPRPRRELPALERPETPTAPLSTSLPTLPQAKRPALRPHGLPDATPLIDMIEEITTPQRRELPDGERIRTPSRDVNLPIDLPTQARFQPDRAPLEDPTTDLSVEKANAQPSPLRTTPAPFVKVNLPEPFEHRASVKSVSTEPGIVTPVPMPPK
jgi:hypothetical protein